MDAKERALQFLNEAKKADSLIRHYYSPKGDLLAYIIGGSISKQILELRDKVGGKFDSLDPILDLIRFGENKLELLVNSFEESYLKKQEQLEMGVNEEYDKLKVLQDELDHRVVQLFTRMFAQVNANDLNAHYLELKQEENDVLELQVKQVNIQQITNPFTYKKIPLTASKIKINCRFLNYSYQFQTMVDVALIF